MSEAAINAALRRMGYDTKTEITGHGFRAMARTILHEELHQKAQSQCRATLETLAAIKNPPVIYAKQANISNGPQ